MGREKKAKPRKARPGIEPRDSTMALSHCRFVGVITNPNNCSLILDGPVQMFKFGDRKGYPTAEGEAHKSVPSRC